jgi:ATP-binding region, ATPase-like protein
MERIVIDIPDIKSNFDGYNYLCSLYHQLKIYKDKYITFDFSKANFIEANLCALIGTIFEMLEENNNIVSLENINHKIANILRKNSFLIKYGYPTLNDRFDTSLKYERLNPQEETKFYGYIKDELFSKTDFPSLSNRLRSEITKNIFELYENARTHGKCNFIHICGQFFPKAPKKPLHFTIVDKGITIKENVCNFRGESLSGSETIQWAIVRGNSTKQEVGGLGLGIIFEFIKLNKGKIHIVSADGYYEFSNGQETTKTLSNPFEGTLVNLTFDLTDKHHYYLEEESLDNIF